MATLIYFFASVWEFAPVAPNSSAISSAVTPGCTTMPFGVNVFPTVSEPPSSILMFRYLSPCFALASSVDLKTSPSV